MKRRSLNDRRATGRAAVFAVALLGLVVVAGCEMVAIVGDAATPKMQKVSIEAQYLGLEGKQVAVFVAVPSTVQGRHPSAQTLLCRSISKQIKVNVSGAQVVNPDQIVKWQQDNPDWVTLGNQELIARINVDRIVFVDVGEYRLNEPGNRYELRGVINSIVSVIEPAAEGSSRDLAFQTNVATRYPEEDPVGRVDVDEQSMEFATVAQYTQKVAGLFYDHTIERERKR